MRIAMTGYGAVTPLGDDVEPCGRDWSRGARVYASWTGLMTPGMTFRYESRCPVTTDLKQRLAVSVRAREASRWLLSLPMRRGETLTFVTVT